MTRTMSILHESMNTPIIRSVAILSGKGGTGKSIVCASMGYILAHCGFRTVLVDTDLFTAGLSFYVLSDNPRRVPLGLQDVFLRGADVALLEPVKISNPFTVDKLYLMPSISTGKIQANELNIPECLTSVR